MKILMIIGVTLLLGSGCASSPTMFKPKGHASTPFPYTVWKDAGGEGEASPTLTPKDTWRTAYAAHSKALRLFNYKRDKYMTGKADVWLVLGEVRPVTGDCEDFTILAREILKEAGITDTRFIVAKVGDTYHMVLEYRGWILDNREKGVVTKDHLNYRWVKLQDYDGKWKSL